MSVEPASYLAVEHELIEFGRAMRAHGCDAQGETFIKLTPSLDRRELMVMDLKILLDDSRKYGDLSNEIQELREGMKTVENLFIELGSELSGIKEGIISEKTEQSIERIEAILGDIYDELQ